MNLSLAKSALWLGSLGVFGWLGYQLYDYKTREADLLSERVTAARQREIIDGNVTPPEVDESSLVDYGRVVANFHTLNWTGKKPPPPPPPPPPGDQAPKGRLAKPINELLTVLYIQVDSTKAERSLALASPLATELEPDGGGQIQLLVGDALATPYEYWVVDGIEAEGVRFAYLPENDEDAEREPEWARPPAPIRDTIVELGDGQTARVPTSDDGNIPDAPPGVYGNKRPDRTIEVSPGRYRLGEEDLREFGENYLDILSSEVRTKPHMNPNTKKWAGFELTSIAPGSIASQHGAVEGDVVISINGHPVNSVNEAITYAKNNQDSFNSWHVVVVNAGIERTLTFETD